MENVSFPNPVVILVNGEFPSHSLSIQKLNNAGTIICTDGSADKLLAHERTPDVIIGDMDSTKLNKDDFKVCNKKIWWRWRYQRSFRYAT